MVRTDLTVEDVAWEMNVGHASVRRLIESGRLTAYKVYTGQGPWRITRENLERFKRENSNETLLRKPKHDLARDIELAAVHPYGIDPLGPDYIANPLTTIIHRTPKRLWMKGILWGYALDTKLRRLRFPPAGILQAIDRGFVSPADRRPPATGTRRRRRSSLLPGR